MVLFTIPLNASRLALRFVPELDRRVPHEERAENALAPVLPQAFSGSLVSVEEVGLTVECARRLQRLPIG
jgi:hypothetical protein